MSLHWLPVKRKVDFRILLMTVPRARLKTKVDYYSTVLPLLLWKLKNNFIYILVSLFYCCSCLFLLLYSLLWSMYRCFCCYASSVIKHCLNRLYKWSINSSIQPRCNNTIQPQATCICSPQASLHSHWHNEKIILSPGNIPQPINLSSDVLLMFIV